MNSQKNQRNSLILTSVLLLMSGLSQAAEVISTTYYHHDALGSPIAATDDTGKLLWRESYYPYGERIQNDPNAIKNARWFTGHPQDAESGLIYMGARYYDPRIGRFMAIDPIGYQINNLHSFNRYAYANNNPYKYVDPDGRIAETALDVVSLGLSIGVYNSDPSFINGLGVAYDGLATFVPFLPAGFGIAKSLGNGIDVVGGVAKSASSSVNGLKLQKQLASQEQLGQLSKGGGTVISQPAKQANRIAAQTGRNPANIQKVSSSAKPIRDGTQIQTHSFRDVSTNELIEPKTIIGN